MKASIRPRSGFTLLELMVAVAITSIIIVVLLSMTGVIADAWRTGNNKIFTNNEARAGFARLAEDLENAIIRDNVKDAEWFVSFKEDGNFGKSAKPTNDTWLMFYTTPTDRQLYEKLPGTNEYDKTKPRAGNVIAVSYKIVQQDPIPDVPNPASEYKLYGLYRAFPDNHRPDSVNAAQITFGDGTPENPGILGKPDLKGFWAKRDEFDFKDNFYISNIFDFSFTYWISKYETDGTLNTIALKPTDAIRVTSEGVWVNTPPVVGAPPPAPPNFYAGAKLASVDISMTILTQEGAQRAREKDIPGGDIKKFVSDLNYARTYSHKIYFAPEAQRAFTN